MIEVFVSYAGKDRGAAMPIIEALAQAGLKLWDGDAITSGPVPEQVRRQLQAAQCVVILWSQAAAQSPYVQVEIHEAIQAWSTDRLVLAALDDTPLPVGLRDLPAISIRDPFDSSTRKLIEHVQATVRRAAIVASESAPAPVEAPPPARSAILAPRRFPLFASIIAAALAAGFAVLVAVTVMWLPADTSDSPSPPPPLGPSLPTNFSPEPASPLLLMLLILGAAIGAGAVWVWTSRSRRRLDRAPSTALSPPALAASSSGLQVFISYSRHDRQAVEQLVRQIEQLGYAVWIDRQSTGSHRYAAPIVRAIRMSKLVALMCSQNAFSSDHVIREVYVAGDCKKPFIAFQLDPTELPDELLYFVSGFPRVSVATIDPQQLRSEIARLFAV